MTDVPPPPDFEFSSHPRPSPPKGAPGGPSAEKSQAAGRLAVIGFSCGVGSLVVLALSVAALAGSLLVAGGILWVLGLGTSIAALSMRDPLSPNLRRLAIAGIVIPIGSLVAILVLIVYAVVSFISDPLF